MTTSEAPRRETKINFRLEAQQKHLIEEAASIMGQSLTSFAISTLMTSAQEIVERFGRTSLSDRDRDLFLTILDSDEAPTPALAAAAARYGQKVG